MRIDPLKKRAWWQYSLRGLLIAMIFVGFGCVAFRWPWVEKEIFTDPLGYSETQIRTFRRNWNGKPVRHGLQKFGPFEEFYVDDVKTWEARYSNDSQLKLKRHFLGDDLHGPFFDAATGTVGEYRLGKKHGRWTTTFVHADETVKCEQFYDNGIATGEWIWKSGEQVLQTAKFEQGKLTLWNGKPVATELARVLAAKNVDAPTRDMLGARVSEIDFDRWSCHGGAAFEWPLREDASKRLVMQVPMCNDMCLEGAVVKHLKDRQQPVSEAFLEQALLASRTLDYRFGVICFVPIARSEIAWQDRSGVSQIQFTPGSREEAAWLELVHSGQGMPDPQLQLQELFAGTPIQIEVANPRQPPARTGTTQVDRDPVVLRSRRDVLGMLLVSRGWTCQLRGNKLEITPSSKPS